MHNTQAKVQRRISAEKLAEIDIDEPEVLLLDELEEPVDQGPVPRFSRAAGGRLRWVDGGQLNNHPSRYRLDSQLKQPNTPTPPPIPLNTATRTPQTTRPTEDRIALNTRFG
ncbi:uncharacterized protein PGTG_05394 [Puccinia graminis f. sp. tritici CRL 75-36-700-3]|uniref:Uncharacterized protein n=1 Tax=Puccinia graminis f. sp. tritici (strain CRL 75-36-700-3 / race SCCL) TaxID=418459 RepID=E3K6P9_PUCGT|nr:uncharacterized protein PGTG_05394 [Puccinia graminis f. sp. tritici CRL 75-36-700-3]EFP80169.1 hypothetical protein PGTG_05394 [Puccinia graminis f. sp. tritici CRL 75-36-700-3]